MKYGTFTVYTMYSSSIVKNKPQSLTVYKNKVCKLTKPKVHFSIRKQRNNKIPKFNSKG